MDWWKKFGIRNSKFEICLIIFAAWFVYSPAFHGAWLGDWDDAYEITRNSVLRDPAGLRKIWLAPSALDYYPLKTSVQWVQWRLWGLDPFGYHLTNVALHLLSAFLLWHLLRKLGVRLAWLGGLLFVVHPMMIESVAWIVELKNTLSMAFLLLAFSAWIEFERWGDAPPRRQIAAANGDSPNANEARPGRHAPPLLCYGCAFLFFLAAMLSKTTVVMFPVVLLLYAWWRRGRVGRRDLLASAPFFAVSLVLGLVTIWFQQHRVIQTVVIPVGGFFPRLAVEGLAASFYFWKFVAPVDLMPIYPRWNVDPPSALQFLPWVVIGAVFIALIRWGGAPPRRQITSADEGSPNADQASRGRVAPPSISGFRFQISAFAKDAVFGLGWFLLFLLPVSGFVPIATMRFTWVMDHFAYVSLLGLIGLAVAGLGKVDAALVAAEQSEDGSRRVSTRNAAGRGVYLLSAVVSAVVLALAVSSRNYARTFSDGKTFWASAVERNPAAWPAQYNLALALLQDGQFPGAIDHLEQAVRLYPDYTAAQNNLANALSQTGRYAEAVPHFERALRLDPGSAVTHYNFGLTLRALGRRDEARAQFLAAAKLLRR